MPKINNIIQLLIVGIFAFGCNNYDRNYHYNRTALAKDANFHHEYQSPGNRYARVVETLQQSPREEPLSTFSIDVDTASYTNIRKQINTGIIPPRDAVRIEEMLNYFDYDYEPPQRDRPFAVQMASAPCPWNSDNHLVRIGLKAKEVSDRQRKPANLVFLLDVSGSMSASDKLPLLKKGFIDMVEELGRNDRLAIVVYAGAAGLVLDSTNCKDANKDDIVEALEELRSGGSTNGAGGIKLAYKVAQENFIEGGVNRVILATDGDFNVGVSRDGSLVELVTKQAKSEVFLTVLGFGQGNLNDSMMEKISNGGNGNYFYIDSHRESTRVLCQKLTGTIETVAKDVKLRVEFNPATVADYRLVGYSNRILEHSDFSNDKKDAGDMGAGHQVTALYEVNLKSPRQNLKYQSRPTSTAGFADELLTLKVRYKEPESYRSQLFSQTLKNRQTYTDKDFSFAAAVAAFGQVIMNSNYKGDMSLSDIIDFIEDNDLDSNRQRRDFLALVKKYHQLTD